MTVLRVGICHSRMLCPHSTPQHTPPQHPSVPQSQGLAEPLWDRWDRMTDEAPKSDSAPQNPVKAEWSKPLAPGVGVILTGRPEPKPSLQRDQGPSHRS